MPFNKIHVPSDLPRDTCAEINRELHESLVATCGVNPEDDFSLIVRHDPEDMMFHPTFLGKRNPDATIVIEIVLLGGRTEAQKEHLFRDMRQRLDTIGFPAENSIMYLMENNPVDWSFSPVGSVKTALAL
ncbi:MAG: tautomerase family protein [Pseudomonadota bacterium]